jgi:hypothetical protein
MGTPGWWVIARRLGLALAFALGSAGAAIAAEAAGPTRGSTPTDDRRTMWMTISGKHRFAVTLEDNPTARALVQQLPMSLDMPDLNDNEKHVRLPHTLPTKAARPGTIHTGDVMLYGSDTLVVFYKTFPSSYSYTRIGRVTRVEALVEALGTGAVRIDFSVD